MFKFVDNKDIIKDYFQGLAYFIFIAGLLKAASIYTDGKNIIYQWGVVIVFLYLLAMACFFSLHTCEQMVRVYFPEFISPIKSDYIAPTVREFLTRKDLWLFIFYAIPYLIIGVEIISISTQAP